MYTLLLSRKQKEKLVIKLAEEGKSTRTIANELHMSLKDIDRIIHRATGDDFDTLKRTRIRNTNASKIFSIICQSISNVR